MAKKDDPPVDAFEDDGWDFGPPSARRSSLRPGVRRSLRPAADAVRAVEAQRKDDAKRVAADIRKYTGLVAYTSEEFRGLSKEFFLFKSGIFINFAISAIIAFAIGGGIAGQTFYNFTLDHLRYFGVLKAMGASNRLLLGMIANYEVVA